MPKNLAERFDQYEAEPNSNCDDLKGLTDDIKNIWEENTSLCHFCFDQLVNMYKHLSTCDLKTRESLQLILTMHWDEQQLNAHLCESIQCLEALLGQPSLSLCSTQNEAESNAAETEAATIPTAADIPTTITPDIPPIPAESLKKRGISEDRDNVDGTTKHLKL